MDFNSPICPENLREDASLPNELDSFDSLESNEHVAAPTLSPKESFANQISPPTFESLWKQSNLTRKGILVDVNYISFIKSDNTLGAMMMGKQKMDWLKKNYYKKYVYTFFTIFVICSQLLLYWIIAEPEWLTMFFYAASPPLFIHLFSTFLAMNTQYLRHLFSTFETNYLLLLTAVQGVFIGIVQGWHPAGTTMSLILIGYQLAGVLFDAIPIIHPNFQERWIELMQYRSILETQSTASTKENDPTNQNDHKSDDGGNGDGNGGFDSDFKRRQENHTSLSPFSQVAAGTKAAQTWTSNGTAFANRMTASQPSITLSSDANYLRSLIQEKTVHVLASCINICIEPDPRWTLWTHIRWRFKMMSLFLRLEKVISYLIGLSTTIGLYALFTFGGAHSQHELRFGVLGMNWLASEIMRSVSLTAIIFYTKRVIIMALNPLHMTSAVDPSTLIPLVPEWTALMNPLQKSTLTKCLSEATTVHVDESISFSSAVFSHFETDVRSHQRSQNSPSLQRRPFVLLSSSGMGEIIDVHTPVLRKMSNAWFTQLVRRRISRYFPFWFGFWYAAFVSWYAYYLTSNMTIFYVISGCFIFLLFVIVLLILDHIHDLTTLCLASFETFYILSNMVILMYVVSTYIPTHGGFGIVNVASFCALTSTAILIDAKPISAQRLSSIIAGGMADEINSNQIHKERVQLIMQRVVECFSMRHPHVSLPTLRSKGSDLVATPPPLQISINNSSFGALSRIAGSNFRQVFGGVKLHFLTIGFASWFVYYIILQFIEVEEKNNQIINIFGTRWNNESLMRTLVLNCLIFLAKRGYYSYRYPEKCVAIMKHPLRVPLIDPIVMLLQPYRFELERLLQEPTPSNTRPRPFADMPFLRYNH